MEFRDLKSQYSRYKLEIDEAISNVLSKANFISGEEVKTLESKLAKYVGVKHCITCANGTDALNLALMAWKIGEGDAVFVPDFTFFASGEVVALQGATPVFVDVDKETFNIDTVKLEEAIIETIKLGKVTPKVIVAVDLFGLPANYSEIRRIANQYNLLILEDAAQGFGGSINGKRAGSFGDISTTSFFPAKPLGCYGDGGAIFTDNDNWAKQLESLRIHGKGEDKYDNVQVGLNSRLDTIQAGILNVKLDAFINHELADVNKVADYYNRELTGLVKLPVVPVDYESSWAQYTLTLESKEQREGLQSFLKSEGIPSMVYYVKPMHRQNAFQIENYDEANFPITNRLSDTVLSLPMGPYVTEEIVITVSEVIKKYMQNVRM